MFTYIYICIYIYIYIYICMWFLLVYFRGQMPCMLLTCSHSVILNLSLLALTRRHGLIDGLRCLFWVRSAPLFEPDPLERVSGPSLVGK